MTAIQLEKKKNIKATKCLCFSGQYKANRGLGSNSSLYRKQEKYINHVLFSFKNKNHHETSIIFSNEQSIDADKSKTK